MGLRQGIAFSLVRLRMMGIQGAIRNAPMFLTLCWLDLTDRFDDDHGTDTQAGAAVSTLEVVGDNLDHGMDYRATHASLFRRMVDGLAIDRSQFAFVDLGCGKGRVLLLAAESAFASVIGVEFSPQLAEVARRNVDLVARTGRHSAPIDVICADAATFVFPTSPLVIFLFHPFDGAVMRSVLTNLADSLRATPRAIYLIYANPSEELVVALRAGPLDLVRTVEWHGLRWAIFASHSQAQGKA